ncbi:hypothetical protein SteCoe_36669 [Stentor coeruleus]|uniref:Uncharacterized protein n=1 Tax=Stentor coeruleus TaxID=5963 RepID=A0A1R2APZ3_9CILI|nr:hypothetical protein SteCoe_36669 [Stentor coeruleus]
MKSILCDNPEQVVEETRIPNYYLSARMAQLQNISERFSKLESDNFSYKNFNTILKPLNPLQRKYKSIIEQDNYEYQAEVETQTEVVSGMKKAKSARVVAKKDPPKKQNFIKKNVMDLQVNSVKSINSSRKNSPRNVVVKKNKHVTIANQQISIQSSKKKKDKKEYDSDILGLAFRQFSDAVLDQWEEAADMLINEIIDEHVDFLNSLEMKTTENLTEEITLSNYDDIANELKRIENYNQSMREKYSIK